MLPSQRRVAGHVTSTYGKPLIFCQNSGGTPTWVSFLGTYFLIHVAEYMQICPTTIFSHASVLTCSAHRLTFKLRVLLQGLFVSELSSAVWTLGNHRDKQSFHPSGLWGKKPPSSLPCPLAPDCLKKVWQRLLTLLPGVAGQMLVMWCSKNTEGEIRWLRHLQLTETLQPSRKYSSEAEVMGGKRLQAWGRKKDIFFVILNTRTCLDSKWESGWEAQLGGQRERLIFIMKICANCGSNQGERVGQWWRSHLQWRWGRKEVFTICQLKIYVFLL